MVSIYIYPFFARLEPRATLQGLKIDNMEQCMEKLIETNCVSLRNLDALVDEIEVLMFYLAKYKE